ncbi:hypothetical protein WN48_08591 [Eufriesea mexicana]|nr:hypothetical protein WN48_08591 [Eufriesea mexicana]
MRADRQNSPTDWFVIAEAEHGYASTMPMPDDMRTVTKRPKTKKSQGSRSSRANRDVSRHWDQTIRSLAQDRVVVSPHSTCFNFPRIRNTGHERAWPKANGNKHRANIQIALRLARTISNGEVALTISSSVLWREFPCVFEPTLCAVRTTVTVTICMNITLSELLATSSATGRKKLNNWNIESLARSVGILNPRN